MWAISMPLLRHISTSYIVSFLVWPMLPHSTHNLIDTWTVISAKATNISFPTTFNFVILNNGSTRFFNYHSMSLVLRSEHYDHKLKYTHFDVADQIQWTESMSYSVIGRKTVVVAYTILGHGTFTISIGIYRTRLLLFYFF